MTHRYKTSPQDKQPAMSGKVENDLNKTGNEAPTQKNEGRRSPESRHDRESHIGGNNQTQMRSNTQSPRKPGSQQR